LGLCGPIVTGKKIRFCRGKKGGRTVKPLGGQGAALGGLGTNRRRDRAQASSKVG